MLNIKIDVVPYGDEKQRKTLHEILKEKYEA